MMVVVVVVLEAAAAVRGSGSRKRRPMVLDSPMAVTARDPSLDFRALITHRHEQGNLLPRSSPASRPLCTAAVAPSSAMVVPDAVVVDEQKVGSESDDEREAG